jgi:hypothetical protein
MKLEFRSGSSQGTTADRISSGNWTAADLCVASMDGFGSWWVGRALRDLSGTCFAA